MNRNALIRNAVVFFLFLIPIFPLIVTNSLFFPFISGKAFYFRILVELAFFGWVLLAFLEPAYRPKISPLSVGITIFTFVVLIADIAGVNPLRSLWSNFERMEGWLAIVHLWAFFVIASNVFGNSQESKKYWHGWFNASLFFASIVAIYGLVQLWGGAVIHQGSTRIDASLGNAAYMAVYMLIHVFVAGYMFFVTRKKDISSNYILSWVYAVLFLVFSFLVFETQTRGTILGLIGGIVLALTVYAVFGRNETNNNRMIAMGGIVLIIVAGIVFWSYRDSNFVKNSELLNRLATISWNDTKTQARGYVWPMAIKGFTERPVLGWGQENFNYIFNTNYHPKMWNQEQWFDRAHSVFLDWLVAGGLLGFLSYISLYIILFIAIWRSPLGIDKKSVLTGLVSAYAVHNIFVFDNIASYVFFFAVMAFVDSLAEKEPRRLFYTISASRDLANYIAFPIILIAFVFVLYFFNIRYIQSGSRLIQAMRICANGKADTAVFDSSLGTNVYGAKQEIREQLLFCVPSVLGGAYNQETKQAFFGLALRELDAQIKDTPLDARAYVIGGSFLNNINQFATAEPLLEKALELSPNKQSIAFQLANTYINIDKMDRALEVLKKAYEDAPEYVEAKMSYAIVLVASGKGVEAKKIFAGDMSVLENERIADAYASAKDFQSAISIYRILISKDKTNVELRARLARVLYLSGSVFEAIEILRGVEKERPDLKPQIDAAIKEMQK